MRPKRVNKWPWKIYDDDDDDDDDENNAGQTLRPVAVAARSKAYVYGRSPAEIVGSNPTGCMDVCVLRVLCVIR